ncbi:unnamed protein product [Closterium sp. NIES-53]
MPVRFASNVRKIAQPYSAVGLLPARGTATAGQGPFKVPSSASHPPFPPPQPTPPLRPLVMRQFLGRLKNRLITRCWATTFQGPFRSEPSSLSPPQPTAPLCPLPPLITLQWLFYPLSLPTWLSRCRARTFRRFLISQPTTLSFLPTLPAHPLLLVTTLQWDFYQHVAQPLLGNDLSKSALLNISDGEIYFAEEVYVPLYQACGKASPSIWTDIRHRFLLPPKGLPVFRNNQWDVRHVSTLNSANASVIPPDWLVVVARRPGTKRALDKFDALLEAIKRIFGHTRVQVFDGSIPILSGECECVPPRSKGGSVERLRLESIVKWFGHTRVQVFDGSIPILQAQKLFRRARLFVAGHGAAMANMVFMPANATVLEIRPDKYENACYHHLAYACELRYYLTFGKGDFESQVQVDLGEVSDILQGIKDGFAPLPGDEHPNFS